MVRTVELKATMQAATVTQRGRQVLAAQALRKGESFILAAILLRRSGGHPQVVAHLYLQGLEVVLKCVLQIIDPAQYTHARIKKFGHDLVALLDECWKHNGLRWRPRGFTTSRPFVSLAGRYKVAHLRYPHLADWFTGNVALPPPLISFVLALLKWARRAATARGLAV
ncbi:hypothetical protein J5Y09_04175 [Roseomonas sp. PWR1]|uniref:HEPN domain-containing protein n=1 Tax=Roseomonas nitratireducens TaxID=2820810 RepID=A0ABS4AP11_9PROT|nr:hypothetical protein [Neoroseomonas nitratireducens]MBP0463098.1 hypothetical protein [Neoroseomonas nitratireducens]